MSAEEIRSELLRLKVRLVPHRESKLTTLYGWVAGLFGVKNFTDTFWLTLEPVIYYPNCIKSPLDGQHTDTIYHELVHVRQQRRAGLFSWVARYLASQRFRWEQEREAYLVDVDAGADPRHIAASMRDSYKITRISEQEMACWLETHRCRPVVG